MSRLCCEWGALSSLGARGLDGEDPRHLGSMLVSAVPQIHMLVFEPWNFGKGPWIQVQRGPRVTLIPQTESL